MRIHKIKSPLIYEDLRLNAGYFLNEDALNSRRLEFNRDKTVCLEQIANVWNPPIFKRQFCQKTERAVQYFQSSDVTNLLEGSTTYILKEQAEAKNTIVKTNQILVTGFGTIGNTKLVNELTNGTSFANNVCRIEVNQDNLYGYVYAFMSSKYGRSQLNKNASGSVVRYIEAPGIKKTLVPLLSKEKQTKIHQLIVDAAALRVEANRLLEEAVSYFDFLKTTYTPGESVSNKVSIGTLNNGNKRFDGSYNIISNEVEKIIEEQNIEFVTISRLASGIFIGPRSKRNYLDNGVPFLSTSEMQKADPTKTEKFISKSVAEDFLVKEGWLLTTRSGTLGDTVFVLPCMNDYAVTEDAIRIVTSKESCLTNKYLFAFLKSDLGRSSLLSGSYGSVILHLNEGYVGEIKVPVLTDKKQRAIENNVSQFVDKIDLAIKKENQAISLIEKEIDLWQN